MRHLANPVGTAVHRPVGPQESVLNLPGSVSAHPRAEPSIIPMETIPGETFRRVDLVRALTWYSRAVNYSADKEAAAENLPDDR